MSSWTEMIIKFLFRFLLKSTNTYRYMTHSTDSMKQNYKYANLFLLNLPKHGHYDLITNVKVFCTFLHNYS